MTRSTCVGPVDPAVDETCHDGLFVAGELWSIANNIMNTAWTWRFAPVASFDVALPDFRSPADEGKRTVPPDSDAILPMRRWR